MEKTKIESINEDVKKLVVLNFKGLLITICGLGIFGLNVANYYGINQLLEGEKVERSHKNVFMTSFFQTILLIITFLGILNFVLNYKNLNIIEYTLFFFQLYFFFSTLIFGIIITLKFNFTMFNYLKAILLFPLLKPFSYIITIILYSVVFYVIYLFPPSLVFIFFPLTWSLNKYMYKKIEAKLNY